MADTLTVDLNREGPYEITAPGRFETDGEFTVRLRNHGEPVHVHVRADDTLASVARPEGVNHYVDAETERDVAVLTDDRRGDAVTGTLEVATGHGAEQSAIEVTVLEPGATDVAVDTSLAEPTPERRGPTGLEREDVRAGALAALAVLAVAAAMVTDGAIAVAFGVITVLAVLGVAYVLN